MIVHVFYSFGVAIQCLKLKYNLYAYGFYFGIFCLLCGVMVVSIKLHGS
jgi:hypothetical protein